MNHRPTPCRLQYHCSTVMVLFNFLQFSQEKLSALHLLRSPPSMPFLSTKILSYYKRCNYKKILWSLKTNMNGIFLYRNSRSVSEQGLCYLWLPNESSFTKITNIKKRLSLVKQDHSAVQEYETGKKMLFILTVFTAVARKSAVENQQV